MTAFRAAVAATAATSTTSTSPALPLAATMAFHAGFRAALRATDCLELEGMTRDNADDQLARTREAISEQDPRLPRFSEKVGEWLGSVADFLEDVDWGINTISEQSQWLREVVLEGGHVWEKAAVSVSIIRGKLTPARNKALEDKRAGEGMGLVFHILLDTANLKVF